MQYLQIPFAERGRTRDGLDCYGLVRHVFHVERQIELPSYAEEYATTTDAEEITTLCRHEVASSWREMQLPDAQMFDVAVFRIFGQPIHFALVLDPPWMLHTMQGAWSHTERWDGFIWQRRLVQVVRWHGAQPHER